MKKKTALLAFLVLAIGLLLFFNLRLSLKINTDSFPPAIYLQTPAPQSAEAFQVKLILTGDIMLGRTVMIKTIESQDYSYAFLKVKDRLKTGDLVFANLENPIVENCPVVPDGMVFCALPAMLQGLIDSGINVVSLANNHTRNYGAEGYLDTQKFLEKAGIAWVDERNLAIKEMKGIKFGFLGFNLTTENLNSEDLEFVRQSKGRVDWLIVGVHWGSEYTALPSRTQKTAAEKLIQNGADIISGHHPHWTQPVSCLQPTANSNNPEDLVDSSASSVCSPEAKPVFYSLGNLVFDQMWSEQTKKGMVAELTFENKQLLDQKLFRTYMSSWVQPEFVE